MLVLLRLLGEFLVLRICGLCQYVGDPGAYCSIFEKEDFCKELFDVDMDAMADTPQRWLRRSLRLQSHSQNSLFESNQTMLSISSFSVSHALFWNIWEVCSRNSYLLVGLSGAVLRSLGKYLIPAPLLFGTGRG